uniref:DUF3421 domain-containing protein n=1 Tax=Anopheles coluzzii TaxID=1518534 RepID=A0A8W7PYF2_ANOCL
MNSGFNWIPWTSHQGIPPAAVYGGNDQDGSPIYIGRAYHEGDQLPAKVIPSKQAAYVSHNGMEIFKTHFETLYIPYGGSEIPIKNYEVLIEH